MRLVIWLLLFAGPGQGPRRVGQFRARLGGVQIEGQARRSARRSSAAARSAPPAGSLAMTRTVSSPATVPRIELHRAWSSTEAKYWAAPAGVRRTTRLALASAETSSSA